MELAIIMKIVKASTSKPNSKPPPGDKTLGIDPDNRFYEIEDGDKTEEGKASKILIIHYSSLATSNKNIVKRDVP